MPDANPARPVMRLWEDSAPGAISNDPADVPTIEIFRPAAADGSAIVVCPGGGYVLHAEYEAAPVAQWLARAGITGIVLNYRLSPRYRHPAPFDDATRAMRLVRGRAASFGIDPGRIGIMGFSAGGHLAAHVSTHWDCGKPRSSDLVGRLGSRPDVAVLLYPVISFTELSSHRKTPDNLVGENPSRELIERLSCERHVTPQTPPTFIYHATGDPNVPVENALAYAAALRAAHVEFEMHLYDRVAHGVGLAINDPRLRSWPDLCRSWLACKGFGQPSV